MADCPTPHRRQLRDAGEAEAVAQSLREKRHVDVTPYWCGGCGTWHVGPTADLPALVAQW